MVRHAPILRGQGPNIPKILNTPYRFPRFDLEQPNSLMVTHVGEQHVSKGSATPHPMGAVSQRPPILGTLPTSVQFGLEQPSLVW